MGTRRGFIRGLATGVGSAIAIRGSTALAGIVKPQVCADSRFPHAMLDTNTLIGDVLMNVRIPSYLEVRGAPKDVACFRVGDVLRVHLEMRGQIFTCYPHNSLAIVEKLWHMDDDYFYWLPIIAMADIDPSYGQFERRMFNPDHLRRAE